MSDRELLELAAKAARLEYVKPADDYDGSLGLSIGSNPMRTYDWNPLTDDGDALRLAVKLRMSVSSWGAGAAAVVDVNNLAPVVEPHYGDDPARATRRAIVRAAAEIGKRMK